MFIVRSRRLPLCLYYDPEIPDQAIQQIYEKIVQLSAGSVDEVLGCLFWQVLVDHVVLR